MTRFARPLGSKDVRDLKVKLGQCLLLDVPDLEGVQGIDESIISVLETNRSTLDPESLQKAVGWLTQSRQILAIGMDGGSTICAQKLQYRLILSGSPVTL